MKTQVDFYAFLDEEDEEEEPVPVKKSIFISYTLKLRVHTS